MKRDYFVFAGFLLITLITYIPSIGAGFVFDFVGWQYRYEHGNAMDIIHCFGYTGNLQVLHLFFFSVYKLFHIQGIPWFVLFCGLHAFNAWLAYTWIQTLRKRWVVDIPDSILLLVCLIFLLHPYAAEPVVYKACIHYLLSLTGVLAILLMTTYYLHAGSIRHFRISLILFAASLFLLELSYMTPLLISLYAWISWHADRTNSIQVSHVKNILAAFWGGLVLVLVVNKLTIGAWVGHYGSDVHFRFDLLSIAATEIKYLVKHIFDARFLSYPHKALLFDKVLSYPPVIVGSVVILGSLLLYYFIRIRRWRGETHLTVFAFLASCIYVAPVSNLFFYYFSIGMNDRFSYVPLLFIWIALLSLFTRMPRKPVFVLLGLILIFQLYWQQKTIRYWRESTDILTALKADYRWHDRSHVFVLNSPDNYKGIVMASAIKIDSGIDELIDYQTPKPNNGIMYDVFQFNMTSANDGAKVEQTGPMQLKVSFNQWGTWWHRAELGYITYENEYYKAEPNDLTYTITFKQLPPSSAIIYQDGMKWKEFKMDPAFTQAN